MIRKAKPAWGGGRSDSGGLSTDTEKCSLFLQARVRTCKDANQKELIAAAHAGCLTMAFAFGCRPAALLQPS